MKISLNLLRWSVQTGNEKALAFYIAMRELSVDSAGYFVLSDTYKKQVRELTGFSEKTQYRHLSTAIDLGMIVKVKAGHYRIVAHHKICVALDCMNPVVVVVKWYHLLYFKAFIQAAHGRAFVSWMNGLSLEMRGRRVKGDKPCNQGQYALSLVSNYLGYSISKASTLRKLSWEKSISKKIRTLKTRTLSNDVQGAIMHKRRTGTDAQGTYFIEGYEEAFLIKLSLSSSLFKKTTSEYSRLAASSTAIYTTSNNDKN